MYCDLLGRTRLQCGAGPRWMLSTAYDGMQYLQKELILFSLCWYKEGVADRKTDDGM